MKTSAWRKLWEESDLPACHRRVLSAVTHSMGDDGGQDLRCYPGARVLHLRSGYSEKWVRRTLDELDGGWLTIRRRPGLPSLYLARTPDPGWVLEESTWSRGRKADRAPQWSDPGTVVPGSNPGTIVPGSRGTPAPRVPEPRHRSAYEIQRREEETEAMPSGPSAPRGGAERNEVGPGETERPPSAATPSPHTHCPYCGSPAEEELGMCSECFELTERHGGGTS